MTLGGERSPHWRRAWRGGPGMGDFHITFQSHLTTMARAHDLLNRGVQTGAGGRERDVPGGERPEPTAPVPGPTCP
jgi:hypothetical protein